MKSTMSSRSTRICKNPLVNNHLKNHPNSLLQSKKNLSKPRINLKLSTRRRKNNRKNLLPILKRTPRSHHQTAKMLRSMIICIWMTTTIFSFLLILCQWINPWIKSWTKIQISSKKNSSSSNRAPGCKTDRESPRLIPKTMSNRNWRTNSLRKLSKNQLLSRMLPPRTRSQLQTNKLKTSGTKSLLLSKPFNRKKLTRKEKMKIWSRHRNQPKWLKSKPVFRNNWPRRLIRPFKRLRWISSSRFKLLMKLLSMLKT